MRRAVWRLFVASCSHSRNKKQLVFDKDVVGRWYPEKDFHTLYIAEIEKVL